MVDFLILPTQLFEKEHLKKENEYTIWEHPHYFKEYNYNKKKLILHRASMKYYFDYLKKNKFKISYCEFDKKPKEKKYHLFDPVDKLKLSKSYTIVETPNFLLPKEELEKYKKKTKSFFFNSFYMHGKKVIDIIPKVKSQDKLNRKKFKDNIKITKKNKYASDNKYVKEAISYVNKNFKNNYGNTDNFIYPISHNSAKKWLKIFLDKQLKTFGDYQDYIDKDANNNMFHSLLSTSINIGLINPTDIIDILRPKDKKYPMNSFEGYIRQLFWREYQRYCYIYYNFNNKNYFNNNKKLTKEWYTGETGILPVDTCIKKAFDTGYLHHIERLMVVGNYMMISQIKPTDGYRWFIEFSCDSYDWVMHQNVLDMVFCVSGGETMRKPYISKSTYILKMSNYSKGEWSKKWDKKYIEFCKKNKNKLLSKFKYHFHFIKYIASRFPHCIISFTLLIDCGIYVLIFLS